MVRPTAKSPPNFRRYGRPQTSRSARALAGLVDQRRADVARLEQHRLQLVAGGLRGGLGHVEDPLRLLGAAGDVGIERMRPVDLHDVDADQLGLRGRASSHASVTMRLSVSPPDSASTARRNTGAAGSATGR